MSTMIERVARAIDAKAYEQEAIARRFVESSGRTWEGSWEQSVHKSKIDVALRNARAAIAAMMEPTDAMKRAGFEAVDRQTSCSHFQENGKCGYCGQGFTKYDDCGFAAVAAMRAMIDAALEEAP